MNNDLISREALKKQVKELLDLAVKWVDDTPNNSPCYRMYVAQENERARLIDLIDNAPIVDLTENQAYDKGFITAMKLYAKPQSDLADEVWKLYKKHQSHLATHVIEFGNELKDLLGKYQKGGRKNDK